MPSCSHPCAALGQATLIYLAPDGALNLLPFEALVDEQGNYLVESRRFVYLSSGRDLLRPAAAPARGTVVFADPDYDLDAAGRQAGARTLLASLPAAPDSGVRGALADELRGNRWESLKNFAAEAKDIKRLLDGSGHGPVTVYLGPEALEERFKTMPAPRVLHVITHGFYLKGGGISEERDPPGPVVPGFGMGRGLGRLRRTEDPLLRSGLVLAGANRLGEEKPGTTTVDDGWLTAGEIAALDLRGTELVVLSACETGLGDVRGGEGVYGLRRAFLYAGGADAGDQPVPGAG